jgi:Ser/Thr protein kinase RdoA (MazF antagonist)
MKDGRVDFDAVAGRALAAYGREDLALAFIQHSENVTFRVQGPGEAFLLRIHVPVTPAMGAHGASYDAVRSELSWLEALCRDTDLALQEPVRNRQGELVTRVPIGGDRTVNCTLLRWLEGQPYDAGLESEQTVRQMGGILATLHLHASRWEPPEGFVRPRRDVAYFEEALQRLRPAVRDGRMAAPDFAVLETSVALLVDTMRGLDRSRQSLGIIHADAHGGNMLVHRGRVMLIDFSSCAIGNYMYDLGICLSGVADGLRPVLLDGYRALCALPDGYERLVEGFFVGSDVGMLSYWVSIPEAQQEFARWAPRLAREYAARFNRDERFWFPPPARWVV